MRTNRLESAGIPAGATPIGVLQANQLSLNPKPVFFWFGEAFPGDTRLLEARTHANAFGNVKDRHIRSIYN